MEKVLVIFLFVTISQAFILQENTHHNLQNESYIQSLSKSENYRQKVVVVTRIKFRYFPAFHKKIPISLRDGGSAECLENSSEDFPKDLFTIGQKRNGAVILHFILGIYCFTLVACVCNDYFLPAVEVICKCMNLSQDIAAATFMAIATSAPEFFVNVVGTFITESDIGVGTIVGSSMFNTLGVAALGGLACKSYIELDWWPITRDSVIYICTVTMLVIMAKDEKIQWYEAAILLSFYVVYFLIMWQNKRIYKLVMKIGDCFRRRTQFKNFESSSSSPEVSVGITTPDILKSSNIKVYGQSEELTKNVQKEEEVEEEILPLWHFPHETNKLTKVWWLYSWPIRFLLFCTVPDCRKRPYLFPVTFIMCIVWIGSNSYLVSWMITIIGTTFKIPDFVMGVTFLAAGGCLPEAISIVIVARKGQGGMGVSNSLGANTLTILLSLGLPWFIKTMIGWSSGGTSYIQMDSDSLFYTILALIVAVVVLYTVVSLSGYRLSKKVGIILICMYIIFLAMAISLEIFMYYDGKLSPCAT